MPFFGMDTRPLAAPPFRRLWTSTIVTSIGSQLTAVSVPIQLYSLTRSSFYVGLSGALALVPLILFGVVGGAIADVVDRRRLLLVTNSGIAITSMGFFALSATGHSSVWALLCLLVVQLSFFAVNAPTRNASIARLVPVSQRPAANALFATVLGFGLVCGPLVAGALIPVVGISAMYLIDSVGLLATLWSVYKLPGMKVERERSVPSSATGGAAIVRRRFSEVRDGFAYICTKQILLVSSVLDAMAMILGMPRALFPQMAHEMSGTDRGITVGLLYAAIPIGGVLTGLFSRLYVNSPRQGLLLLRSVVVWGVAITAFGLSRSLLLDVGVLGIAGGADMIGMVMRSSILQTETSDDMQGRVQGAAIALAVGGPRLADLFHGMLASLVGTAWATSLGGALVVAAVLSVTRPARVLVAYRVDNVVRG